jgi:hypothetical protein
MCNLSVTQIRGVAGIAGWAQWLGDGLGDLWFHSGQRKKNYLFYETFRPVMGPTKSPTHWLPRDLSSLFKRLGRKVDHLALSSAKVKNEWRYTSTSCCAQELFCLCKYKHVTKELSEYLYN